MFDINNKNRFHVHAKKQLCALKRIVFDRELDEMVKARVSLLAVGFLVHCRWSLVLRIYLL